MTIDQLYDRAFAYLELNPERFTDQEKMKFMQSLQEWIAGTSETIDDEVYDFLITAKLADKKSREEVFASYLNEKYGYLTFRRVMDIGAGRMCKLSTLLAKNGTKMYAIDPNIRLSESEAYDLGIAKISRDPFVCDWALGRGGVGTKVKGADILVGLEPCDATEHIIRQGLKYDKPFDVVLCAAPHDSMDGKKFRSYEEWYEYLLKISGEVDINKVGNSYIASNDPQMFNELER